MMRFLVLLLLLLLVFCLTCLYFPVSKQYTYVLCKFKKNAYEAVKFYPENKHFFFYNPFNSKIDMIDINKRTLHKFSYSFYDINKNKRNLEITMKYTIVDIKKLYAAFAKTSNICIKHIVGDIFCAIAEDYISKISFEEKYSLVEITNDLLEKTNAILEEDYGLKCDFTIIDLKKVE